MRREVRLVVGLVLVAVAAVHASTPVTISRQDADSFQRKALEVTVYGQRPLDGARLTPFSESELNSYLRLDMADSLPTGVTDPLVAFVGDGRVSVQAVVDLDRVNAERPPTGWLDPMAYVSGRVPVAVSGTLTTERGRARFALEDATMAGVRVPQFVLQEVVTYYTRSPEYPNGVSLDEPFLLPAQISEIHLRAGRAVVIQR